MFSLSLLGLVLMRFSPLAGAASVILAWDPSTDPLIAGYSLYYGGASQTYTNEISVGLVTTATLSGLAEGNTYYFAATTYNELGLESPFSSELVYLVPTLSAANQPPTLNAINNLTIIENSSSQTVSLSGITSGSANENQVLAVSAASSDTSLVSNPTVNYTSPNTTGSLTFTSAPNANGTAIITVIVSDGQTRNNTVIRTFTVTVVVDTADYLVINPLTNQVAMTGQIITFSTTANKGGSVKYQWKFNGTNLPLATASSLTLSDVTTNQAGIYSVTASAIGHVSTIQAATLTVTSPAAAQLAPTAQASGQFAFTVTGSTGYNYVVQASTNLVDWVPLQTNTAPFTFVDAKAGSFRQRFYRAVYTP